MALKGGRRTIDLPMTTTPPPVVAADLNSLGLTNVVGVGVSSFRASQPYRITNIQAGARRMSGILIPPGGSFSFNDNLGIVDGRNGFVQGSAIVQNRTQQEWGGGLCQVSTTMFRAAFWAGLPITERHEHTFRISWYEELGEPPGLDATIFTGVADLRFVNDTGGWLLSEAYVDQGKQRLTIVLYGKPSARKVTMSHAVLGHMAAPGKPLYVDDPSLPAGTVKQTDWAQPGVHVQVYRSVKEHGQVIRQDTFDTIFEPWPNIYLRGTGG
jgi:vancomycin resistance protein YoaR